jgi:hypothetical protein
LGEQITRRPSTIVLEFEILASRPVVHQRGELITIFLAVNINAFVTVSMRREYSHLLRELEGRQGVIFVPPLTTDAPDGAIAPEPKISTGFGLVLPICLSSSASSDEESTISKRRSPAIGVEANPEAAGFVIEIVES